MADDPLAFDTERCPIDPVVRIPPCENLLVDPRVPDPPPDIPDCPADPLVPIVEPPCPEIRPEVSEGDPLIEAPVQYGPQVTEAALRFGFRRGACCEFDLEIEVDIPCPQFTPTTPETKTPVWTANQGSLTYVLTPGENGCDFDLDIDLEIHCPQLTPAYPNIIYPVLTPGAQAKLTYGFVPSDSDQCDWDLQIDLELPEPGCPVMKPDTPTEVIATIGPQAKLTYSFTRNEAEDCEWNLDIDFEMPDPSCPLMEPSTPEIVYTVWAAQGKITYQFVKPDPDVCEWNLDIDFDAPCPPIGPSSIQYVYLYRANGVQGYVSWYFTVGSDCDYSLIIDAAVTCPYLTPQTATYVYLYRANGVQGYVAWYFTKSSDCEYDLTIDAVVACPHITPQSIQYVYLYTDHAGGTQGYISWYFYKNDYCEYQLIIDAVVPCPYLEPQTWAYSYVDWGPQYQGYIRWQFTRHSPYCHWELEIDLHLPCPEITNTVVVIVNGYQAAQAISAGYEGAQGSATVTVDEDDCLLWHWTFTFSIPQGPQGYQGYQGYQGPCPPCPQGSGDGDGSTVVTAMTALGEPRDMTAQDFMAPTARISTADPNVMEYGVPVPVHMPEHRIEDVVIVKGPWQPKEEAVVRVPMESGFLSTIDPASLAVVGVVPDRPAVFGAWVEGEDVLLALTVQAAPVTTVALRVSGVHRSRPGRYRQLSTRELLMVELAEARAAEEQPDFNY